MSFKICQRQAVETINAKDFYTQTYKMLDTLTPIKADCGELCESICCSDGGRDDAGMYLYYKEECMFDALPKGFRIEDSDFVYQSNIHAKILMCDGICNRAFRPLSCRIFPLIPYKKPDTQMCIIQDPRAKAICPLARTLTPEQLDPKFLQTVAYIFKVLIKEKHIRDFVIEQSYLLDEYMNFYK